MRPSRTRCLRPAVSALPSPQQRYLSADAHHRGRSSDVHVANGPLPRNASHLHAIQSRVLKLGGNVRSLTISEQKSIPSATAPSHREWPLGIDDDSKGAPSARSLISRPLWDVPPLQLNSDDPSHGSTLTPCISANQGGLASARSISGVSAEVQLGQHHTSTCECTSTTGTHTCPSPPPGCRHHLRCRVGSSCISASCITVG